MIALAAAKAFAWLFLIPRWVWITLGIIVAFLYYGNYTAKKADQAVRLEFRMKEEAEKKRQAEVFKQAREANRKRIQTQLKWRDQQEKEREDALVLFKEQLDREAKEREAAWRKANPKAPASARAPVCDCSVPDTLIRRLPNPRPNPNSSSRPTRNP